MSRSVSLSHSHYLQSACFRKGSRSDGTRCDQVICSFSVLGSFSCFVCNKQHGNNKLLFFCLVLSCFSSASIALKALQLTSWLVSVHIKNELGIVKVWNRPWTALLPYYAPHVSEHPLPVFHSTDRKHSPPQALTETHSLSLYCKPPA